MGLLHSITLSARAIIVDDTSTPRFFAVFRLIKRLNSVGCSIERSPGAARAGWTRQSHSPEF